MTAIVRAHALTRVYGKPGSPGALTAVDGVTVDFEPGLLHVIQGPSGSGKSTLLHLLASLDQPTSGTVEIGGERVSGLAPKALARLRQRTGFVFQRFNLIPSLSAEENIRLPLELAGSRIDRVWFDQLVERLGVQSRLRHSPHELSGGQQQRVALARALLSKPKVIFADEPTGSLDHESAVQVTELLRDVAVDGLGTVIVVTHDETVAANAHRTLHVVDGRLVRAPVMPAAKIESATPSEWAEASTHEAGDNTPGLGWPSSR